MSKHLVLNSLVFAVLKVFINTVNATDIIIDNKEDFPLYASFKLDGKTKITIPANTTKQVAVDIKLTMKISAENGSNIKIELQELQEELDNNSYVLVTLEDEVLKVLGQNSIPIQVKPFRPLT